MNIKEFFHPNDFDRYKEEISRRNLISLRYLSVVGIPMSFLNVLAQNLIANIHTDFVSYAMLVYFILIYIIQKLLIKDNAKWTTAISYLVIAPPLIMTILMGTVLDPSHQALTFLLFLCTMPVFILDVPWRVILNSIFWTALFIVMVFLFKEPQTWKPDLVHVIEYIIMSVSVTIIVLYSRIEGMRMYFEANDSHADEIIRMKDEELAVEKQHQLALEKEAENARQANEAKSAFLFNMSHDLRTPLNAIRGFAELAEMRSDDPETVKDSLEKVLMASNQLTDILNNVLEMARIENRKIVIEEELTDAETVFRSTMAVFEGEMQTKSQKLTTSFDLKHSWLYMDHTHMEEILMNILSNAVKYTPVAGSIYAGFRELPAEKDGECIIEAVIRDSGIGMSKEFADTIFEEFSRERTSSQSGIQGTGLGMAIVRSLVDLMKGTIAIESEVGKGTEITLRIPFRIGQAPQKSPDPDQSASSSILEGKRILVAEDIELNATLLQEILRMNGIQSERAKDGAECLEMLRHAEEGYYDLILMDIQMPIMNGFEATRGIRSLDNPHKASIPIIALSANAFKEDVTRSLEAGMNDHLAKPIDIETMKEKIAVQLAEKHEFNLEKLLLSNGLSRKELEESEEGIYCTDETRRIIYWNPAAERLTGYTREEVQGKHCFYSGLNHEDTCGNQLCQHLCPMLKTIQDGEKRSMNVSALCADGKRRWINVSTKALTAEGRRCGAVERFHAISEAE